MVRSSGVSRESFDVGIIGGGPGGSTSAIYLRKRGYRVVVLDKERFPRFHIGESLLPFNLELFDEVGIHEDLRRAGFVEKHAAEFATSDGRLDEKFYFRNGLVEGHPMAYQVLRSEFDHIILKRARAEGADVREESAVTDCSFDADGVELRVEPKEGSAYSLRAHMMVDASGQHTFLSSRLNLKRLYRDHLKLAVFTHFKNCDRAPGQDGGNIIIFSLEDGGWFWFIPLAQGVTSVGLVLGTEKVKAREGELEEFLAERIQKTPALASRMTKAERVAPVRTISNFSYSSAKFAGDRFILVGDAAAFLDPIFSSGVYMAMSSAKVGAEAVHQAFERGDFRARHFREYERIQRRQLSVYFRLIRAYYRPEFREILLQPSNHLRLQDTVVSVLAGCTHQSLGMRLRLHLFYLIGYLNRYLRLSPDLYRGLLWS
jgi:flavin-dependent dehydrogenase